MLKKDLEQLVKELQAKEESWVKEAGNDYKIIQNLREKVSHHTADEQVWELNQNGLKDQLKEISLICQVFLKVQYPPKEEVLKGGTIYTEFTNNEHTRLLNEIIEKTYARGGATGRTSRYSEGY